MALGTLKEAAVRVAKALPLTRLRIARLKRKADGVLFDWRGPVERGCGGRSWSEIRDAVENDPTAPRVLIATTVGGNLSTLQFDAVMAVALTLRGAKVSFLLCDAALPACMMAQHDWYPNRQRFVEHGSTRDICKVCHPVGEQYLAPFGLPVHRLSTLIDAKDRERVAVATADARPEDAKDWHFDGLPVGEHALAGALRFHARGDLDHQPEGAAIYRAYLRAACLSAVAFDQLSHRTPFDTVLAHHGIYVPQGIWVEAARRSGRRIVTWNPGYRRNCFILSEGDTYHRTMITENVAAWSQQALSQHQDAALTRYLHERRVGAQDWISFGSGRAGRFSDCLATLGLNPAHPTVVLLTSVTWDAQLHYESNAFTNQLEWLHHTLDAFRDRSDVNLVIRIHPAELTGNIRSEQRMAEHIALNHPNLPPHIAVVGPDNPMSTYALADGCDSVLIFSTKTGIELAALGTPVIVAGEAWIRGKGFSVDASSPDDYAKILTTLPLGRTMADGQRTLARRYAYHFFFRRMVPLPGFRSLNGWPPYRAEVQSLEELAEGADPNLDAVCRSLLRGGPFFAVEPQPVPQ